MEKTTTVTTIQEAVTAPCPTSLSIECPHAANIPALDLHHVLDSDPGLPEPEMDARVGTLFNVPPFLRRVAENSQPRLSSRHNVPPLLRKINVKYGGVDSPTVLCPSLKRQLTEEENAEPQPPAKRGRGRPRKVTTGPEVKRRRHVEVKEKVVPKRASPRLAAKKEKTTAPAGSAEEEEDQEETK
ncbi:hypothetical protein V5O48_006722 [Marasmius crinis-equi]|uniref:Uncharacterized protein n=1 Tax=Marasmius crinis-equi TaxID=585013 RepID=A0ABR3FIR0_9AGAR